jgi:hypothetical protein
MAGRKSVGAVTDYKIHPAADVFPMLDGDELAMLQNDIMVEGQLEPIITWNGYVIDGRNRLKACQNINKKPRFKERAFKDESEVIAYIVSTNIRRRHLTTSQRAMIASELAKLEAHRPAKGSAQICADTTQADAAKALNVSRRAVQQAKAVDKADPALAAKVKAGEVTLNAAHRQVAPPKPKKQAEPAMERSTIVGDAPGDSVDVVRPVTPPTSPLYIPPDPDEEPDLPPDLPGDVGEPAKWRPSQHAVEIVRRIKGMSDEDQAWICTSLGWVSA